MSVSLIVLVTALLTLGFLYLGYQVGYQDGHKAGDEKGYQEGYMARVKWENNSKGE